MLTRSNALRINCKDLNLKNIEMELDKNESPLKDPIFNDIKSSESFKDEIGNNDFLDLEQIFEDNFEINYNKILGKGRNATVYEGTDNRNSTKVAIKKTNFTKFEFLLDAESSLENKVTQEISILKKLNHENIIKLHHYYIEERMSLIVLEKCDINGLDCMRIFKTHSYLMESMGKRIICELLSVLDYLHTKIHIISHDIKLQNICFQKCQLKLIDFDCAQNIPDDDNVYNKFQLKKNNSIKGTIHYCSLEKMQPSLLNLQGFNAFVDIWAAGVLLFKIFSSKFPFQIEFDDGKSQIIQKIQSNQPGFDSKDNPIWKQLPKQFQNIIQSCLVIDPKLKKSPKFLLEQHSKFLAKHYKKLKIQQNLSKIKISNSPDSSKFTVISQSKENTCSSPLQLVDNQLFYSPSSKTNQKDTPLSILESSSSFSLNKNHKKNKFFKFVQNMFTPQ